MRFALILTLLLLFTSCAKKASDEVNEAIDIALTLLSSDKCEAAIDILEGVGRANNNPDYLQVLSSAYACRAGYSTVRFVANELEDIDTGAANLMKTLTLITTSDESEADSDSYVAMRDALDILLDSTGPQPSQTAREAKYGVRNAGDMGTLAALLSLTQLGKFLDFYGNVDAAGEKGLGAASVDEQTATPSTCFIEYTAADALLFLGAGGGGICNDMATDDGHPNLSLAAPDLTVTKSRMCEGLMLVTNILDILENITLPANSDLTELNDIFTSIGSMRTTIVTADPDLETLMTTTSRSECETIVADPTEFDNLQVIFALLFEAGLQ